VIDPPSFIRRSADGTQRAVVAHPNPENAMSHLPHCLIATLATALATAHAQPALDTAAPPQSEARVATRLRALPDDQLKAFYLRCSGAALRGELGAGEIATCSLGYHTLLARTFSGDFHALLAWSRQQVHE
jgi:hypothetical protein